MHISAARTPQNKNFRPKYRICVHQGQCGQRSYPQRCIAGSRAPAIVHKQSITSLTHTIMEFDSKAMPDCPATRLNERVSLSRAMKASRLRSEDSQESSKVHRAESSIS